MALEENVMTALKEAMKAKDQAAMRTLRSIKAAILLFKTSGSGEELNGEAEIKLLQKMVKQRKESAGIFHQQNRLDLAQTEEEEIAVLEQFLPAQLNEAALTLIIQQIITDTGATSAKDMGKVIGQANKQLAGKAEGRVISEVVKRLLAS
jgi:uncharacterized protein YqeY